LILSKRLPQLFPVAILAAFAAACSPAAQEPMLPAPPVAADTSAGELSLPLDLFFGDEPTEQRVAAFEAAHRRIQDLEVAVNEAVRAFVSMSCAPRPQSQEGRFRYSETIGKAQAAIDVAMLLRLRGKISSMKLVVQAGGRRNNHLRRAVRTLAALGVEDDFWVECLTKPGENERNYVACVVLCEVWDSPSEKIRSAIASLRQNIKDRRAKGEGINLGLGIPCALEEVSDMEALEAQYAKGMIEEQLRLVAAAGPVRIDSLGGRWLSDYGPNRLWDVAQDYSYLRFRWARKHLMELSEKAPQAVVEHVLALPHQLAKEGKLPEADVAGYRQGLMQCVTSPVRKEIEKRLREAVPGAKQQND
jgi:hypothetical protein